MLFTQVKKFYTGAPGFTHHRQTTITHHRQRAYE